MTTTIPLAQRMHSRAFLTERCQDTIDRANKYIDAGIVIVKTHTPIFSESGRVGCTCEAYKRSDKYRRWCEENGKQFDPNYTCPNPGKHPIGKWKNETIGVTRDQVHDIWGRLWTVTDVDTGKRVQVVYNIGTLTGPSNLLTLDADTYKKHFHCDLSDLIPLDDQETPQQISHSGGMHFVYDREGKPYTNANGELLKAGIEGVDIRGEQGFQVIEPSVGPSGNQYAWVEGYEPWTVKPQPIPTALDTILATAASRKRTTTTKVTFTTPTTAKPDISQWRLSESIKELIHQPKPKGQRSEADMSACVALCYVGAADDEILGVFEHYPIGLGGKFAEAGREYLAHTIAQARAFVAAHPRPDVSATIAHCRNLVVSANWGETIIPLERQSQNGYMTGQTDRKLFDNLLDIMQRAGKIANVNVSYRQLITATTADGAHVAIASVQTAKNFLDRVNGVLLHYEKTDKGTVIHLADAVVTTLDTSKQMGSIDTEVSKVLTTEIYTSHKADDSFASGAARWAREVIQAEKQRLMKENPAYAAAAKAYKGARKAKPETTAELCQLIGAETFATYRELMTEAAADFLPGLGTYGLLVVADLLENPHSTRKEIAERRGLKASSVGTALRKLETWELVEWDKADTFGAPKHYSLVGDVFGEIEAKLPTAKTFRIGVQRLDTRLHHAQAWAQREADRAETEDMRQLAEKRINRITQQRFQTVPVLHPEMSMKEVARHIYTPAFAPEPKKAEAPEMPEPGQIAWYRLVELTGKQLLTADEFGELQQLDRVLGAGVLGRHGEVAYA